MASLCNFIYIGPDKAGSTWLFKLLSNHPDVFMTPAKDLYFFDRYYEKGFSWYASQFAGGEEQRIVGEISHDYLYSREAAKRIHHHLPDVQLGVCLREPVERTFSAYLHLLKTGNFSGSFEEALEQHPDLIDRSLYGQHLDVYRDYFDDSQIHLSVFDDLKASPQRFSDELFDGLGISRMCLPAEICARTLPAGRSRSVWLTRLVRWGGDRCRDAGMPGIVGKIKTSSWVQRMLYEPYRGGDKPKPEAATVRRLREIFAPDIARLDRLFDCSLAERWGYGMPVASPPRRIRRDYRPQVLALA